MNKREFELVTEGIDKVYTFVLDSHDYYAAPKDYGNGEMMNMAEMHTLSLIADNPGISVSGVSKMWNRTVSAASQNINRLVKKGLAQKRKEKGDNKTIHLYATAKGMEFSRLHKEYDEKELTRLAKSLLKKHSFEELSTALEVIETGISVIEKRTEK